MAQGTLNAVQTLRATIGFDVYTKPEVDALLDEKADKTSVYTKEETNALLNEKADADSVYTKQETNSLLDAKADKADTYTKTETDNLLDGKADKSTTLAGYGITDAYTKTETDNLLSAKADADSVYTKTEIDTKIPSSVGSAVKPTYVNDGVITECTYELNKTVPANAVFTDTTYSAGNGLQLSSGTFSAKAYTNVTVDGNGISVIGNGTVASADSGLINGGTAYTELRPIDGTWVKTAQTTAINLQKLEGGIEYLYAILSKQYDQLKKYINGNYYDYETDADSKYIKSVPASVMPYASLDSLGGKTVVWNQLAPTGYSKDSTGAVALDSGTQIIAGHKYYISRTLSASVNVTVNVFTHDGTALQIKNTETAIIQTASYSGTSNGTTSNVAGNAWLYQNNGGNTVTVTDLQITDLTLCYGAGNEPTTVAEFQQMFPASYYSYNAGTLLSAGVDEVVSVGKNLLNMMTPWYYGNNFYNLGVGATLSGNSPSIAVTDNGNGTFQFTPTTNWYGCIFLVPIDIFQQHTLKITTTATGNRASLYLLDKDYKVLYNFNNTSGTQNWNNTIGGAGTSYPTARYVAFAVGTSIANSTITITNPQIEVGSTATAYSPYRKITYPIPSAITSLPSYGWSCPSHYNYIDYEAKTFVQEVGSRAYASGDESDATVITDGTTTYYTLSPAVETDISAYLTDDNLISVESGGTLIFPNSNGDDYRIDVPSSETYMIDLQASLGE